MYTLPNQTFSVQSRNNSYDSIFTFLQESELQKNANLKFKIDEEDGLEVKSVIYCLYFFLEVFTFSGGRAVEIIERAKIDKDLTPNLGQVIQIVKNICAT